jgi:hypothetical protein
MNTCKSFDGDIPNSAVKRAKLIELFLKEYFDFFYSEGLEQKSFRNISKQGNEDELPVTVSEEKLKG